MDLNFVECGTNCSKITGFERNDSDNLILFMRFIKSFPLKISNFNQSQNTNDPTVASSTNSRKQWKYLSYQVKRIQ